MSARPLFTVQVVDALPNDGTFAFASEEERYEVRRSIEAAIKRANETFNALKALSTAATERQWSASQRAAAANAVLQEIERTKVGMQADYMGGMPSLFARAANTVQILETLLARSGVSCVPMKISPRPEQPAGGQHL